MSAASDAMANRLRPLLANIETVEKKMFGGVGFMLNGNMLVGASAKGALMVRVDPDKIDAMLARPGAAQMHMGPRPMTGFITVADDAIATDKALRTWVELAEAYVRTMPGK